MVGTSGRDGESGGDALRRLGRAVEAAYGLSVIDLVPVRSAYKVVSPGGLFCLREMRRQGRAKLAFLRDMTDYLWKRGFPRVPRFFPTRSGELMWPYGLRWFTLTSWLPGKECWLEHRPNLESAATGLAALHRTSAGFPLRPEHAPAVRWGTWAAEMAEGERFLKDCLARASAAPRPTSLDRWLVRNFDWVCGRMAKAREGLAALPTFPTEERPGVFCHNSLYYQNILIDEGQTVYFVDLDRAVWDHRARDVAHFLDRYLHRVGWQDAPAYAALGAYGSVWPLSPHDRQLVHLRLLYPERLLKRLRSHYGHQGGDPERTAARVESVARHGRRRAACLNGLSRWVETGRPPR